jgi:hypothetical protein
MSLDAVVRHPDGLLTPARLPPCDALEEMRASAAAVLACGEVQVLRWLSDGYVQWEAADGDALVMGYANGRFVSLDLANGTIPESNTIKNGDGAGRAHPQKRARRRR